MASKDAGKRSVLRFNGHRHSAELASAALLNLRQESFTVDVWVRPEGPNSPVQPILGTNSQAQNVGLQLGLRDMRPYFGFYGNDTRGRSKIPLNAWTHLTWVYDKAAQVQAIYVNGVVDIFAQERAPFSGAGMVNLGHYGGAHFLNGDLANLRIWNRAHDPGEVLSGMHERVDPKTPGLIACWPFEDGEGRTAQNTVPRQELMPSNKEGIKEEDGLDGSDFKGTFIKAGSELLLPGNRTIGLSGNNSFCIEFLFAVSLKRGLGPRLTLFSKGYGLDPVPLAVGLLPTALVVERGYSETISVSLPINPEELSKGVFIRVGRQDGMLTLWLGDEVVSTEDPYFDPIDVDPPIALGHARNEAPFIVSELRIWKDIPANLATYEDMRTKPLSARAEELHREPGLASYWPLRKHNGRGFLQSGLAIPSAKLPDSNEVSDAVNLWRKEEPPVASDSGKRRRTVARLTSEGFQTAANVAQPFPQGFSVSAWVCPDDMFESFQSSAVVSCFDLKTGFELRCTPPFAEFMVHTDSGEVTVQTPHFSPIEAGQWVQLCGVFDPRNQEIVLYVNGVQVTRTPLSGSFAPPSNDSLYFGDNFYWRDRPFRGQLADVVFYDSVLTGDMILGGLYTESEALEKAVLFGFALDRKPETLQDGDFVLESADFPIQVTPDLRKRAPKVTASTPPAPPVTASTPPATAVFKSANAESDAPVDAPSQPDAVDLAALQDQIAILKSERSALEAELKQVQTLWDAEKAVPLSDVIARAEEQVSRAREQINQRGVYRLGPVSLDLRLALSSDGSGAVMPGSEAMSEMDDPLSRLQLTFEEAPQTAAEQKITLPDVVGQTETMARRVLSATGLRLEVAYQVIDAGSDQNGRVMYQDPPAGTQVGADASLRIDIGRRAAAPPSSPKGAS